MTNRSLFLPAALSLAVLLAACAERAPVAPRVEDRASAAGPFPRFTPGGALADPATPGVRRDATPGSTPAGLLWQNTRSGRPVRWTLNPDGTYAGTFAELRRVATYYRIEAEADFNGDGSPDLVWKNTGTGSRSLWLMTGAYWYGSANLPNPGRAWDVAAAADFDRDGKPDLVLRNHDTGEVRIHRMDGTSWTATEWVLPTQPAGFRIVGAGDFDGDGNPDLVWEDPSTGAHWLWLMDGTAWNGRRADIWTAPTYWSVEAVGDANADGKPDLAWSNSGTGERVIWLMDGVAWHGAYASLPTVPTEWKMAAIAPITITAPYPVVSSVTTTQDTTTATFSATVDVIGLPGISWFEYRPNGSSADFLVTPPRTCPADYSHCLVSDTVSGLAPGSAYEVRVVVTNAAGTVRSPSTVFTVAATPPDVVTDSARIESATSARVYGTSDPHGWGATWWFEWGTDPGLAGAAATPPHQQQAGVYGVSEVLQGLTSGTAYFYRLVVSTAAGTTRGQIRRFVAGPPGTPVNLTGNFTRPDYRANLRWDDDPAGGAPTVWSLHVSTVPQLYWSLSQREDHDGSMDVDTARTVVYTIAACNAAGCSPATAPLSVRTTPLPPPSDVVATPIGGAQVRLQWTDNSDETWFVVEVLKPGATQWQRLPKLPANTTSTTISLFNPGTYRFRVMAATLFWAPDGFGKENSNPRLSLPVTTPDVAVVN